MKHKLRKSLSLFMSLVMVFSAVAVAMPLLVFTAVAAVSDGDTGVSATGDPIQRARYVYENVKTAPVDQTSEQNGNGTNNQWPAATAQRAAEWFDSPGITAVINGLGTSSLNTTYGVRQIPSGAQPQDNQPSQAGSTAFTQGASSAANARSGSITTVRNAIGSDTGFVTVSATETEINRLKNYVPAITSVGDLPSNVVTEYSFRINWGITALTNRRQWNNSSSDQGEDYDAIAWPHFTSVSNEVTLPSHDIIDAIKAYDAFYSPTTLAQDPWAESDVTVVKGWWDGSEAADAAFASAVTAEGDRSWALGLLGAQKLDDIAQYRADLEERIEIEKYVPHIEYYQGDPISPSIVLSYDPNDYDEMKALETEQEAHFIVLDGVSSKGKNYLTVNRGMDWVLICDWRDQLLLDILTYEIRQLYNEYLGLVDTFDGIDLHEGFNEENWEDSDFTYPTAQILFWKERANAIRAALIQLNSDGYGPLVDDIFADSGGGNAAASYCLGLSGIVDTEMEYRDVEDGWYTYRDYFEGIYYMDFGPLTTAQIWDIIEGSDGLFAKKTSYIDVSNDAASALSSALWKEIFEATSFGIPYIDRINTIIDNTFIPPSVRLRAQIMNGMILWQQLLDTGALVNTADGTGDIYDISSDNYIQFGRTIRTLRKLVENLDTDTYDKLGDYGYGGLLSAEEHHDYDLLLRLIINIYDEWVNNPEKYFNQVFIDPAQRNPMVNDLVELHSYTATDGRVQAAIGKLDNLLGVNGDLSDIILALADGGILTEAVMETIEGLAGEVEKGKTLNLATILESIFTSTVYTDALITTIMGAVYPAVLAAFEDIWVLLADASGPMGPATEAEKLDEIGGLPTLPFNKPAGNSNIGAGNDWGTSYEWNMQLVVLPLHEVMGGFSGTRAYNSTDPDQAFTADAFDGLKLYPDHVGRWINTNTPTFSSVGNQLQTWRTDLVTSNGYVDNQAGVTNYFRDRLVASKTDPDLCFTDAWSGLLDPANPLDWGIDAIADPAAKAVQFKEALAVALGPLFPLLKALLLGQNYAGASHHVATVDAMHYERRFMGPQTLAGQPFGWIDVESRFPIYSLLWLNLKISGNDGFQKVLTPLFEALAGIDATILNMIPTGPQLRAMGGAVTRSGFTNRHFTELVDANATNISVCGSMPADGAMALNETGMFHKLAFLNGSTTTNSLTGSREMVAAIFNPVTAALDALAAKPVSKIIELLPNLIYMFDFGAASELLDGTLAITISYEADGHIRIGSSANPPANLRALSLYGTAMLNHPTCGWEQINLEVYAGNNPADMISNQDLGDIMDILSADLPPMDIFAMLIGDGGGDDGGLDLVAMMQDFNSLFAALGFDISEYRLGDHISYSSFSTQPSKGYPDGTTRHFLDANKPDQLQALMTTLLNSGVIPLEIQDNDAAFAAVIELLLGDGNYPMRGVDYGVLPTNAGILSELENITGTQMELLVNKLLTAISKNKIGIDIVQIVDDLFGHYVTGQETFDTLLDLLLGFIGPGSDMRDIIEVAAGVVPELLEEYVTWDYDPASTSPDAFWSGLTYPITSEVEFFAAVEKLLGPLVPVLKALLLNVPYELVNLVTIPGYSGYDKGFIPLMEGLGFTEGLLSEAELKDVSDAAFIKALLAPILNVVSDLLEDPVMTVFDLLPKILYFATSGTALYDSLMNLGMSAFVFVDTLRPLYSISIPIEIQDYTTLEGLLNIVSAALSNIDALEDVDLSSVLTSSFVKKLAIAVVTPTNSKSTTRVLANGTTYQPSSAVEYPRNSISRGTYLFNMVTLLVGEAYSGDLQPILESLLNDESVKSLVNELLGNIEANPRAVFYALYQLMFGYPVAQDFIDYDVHTGQMMEIFRDEWWTREHAEYVLDNLDDFVNKLWTLLFGKPLGSVTSDIEGMDVSIDDSFLGDLLGGALFTQDNLDKLVNLVTGFLNRDLLEKPVMDMELGELIKNTIIFDGKNGPEGLDLYAVLDVFESYNTTDFPGNGYSNFMNSIVKLLTPAVPIIDILLAGTNLSVLPYDDNGTDAYLVSVIGGDGYKYGLLPLLEALGLGLEGEDFLDRLVSPDDYYNLSNEDKLKSIVEPILWIFEELAGNPIYTLLKMLPNLIYTMSGTNLQNMVDVLLVPVNELLPIISPIYDVASIIPDIPEGSNPLVSTESGRIEVKLTLDDLLDLLAIDLSADQLKALMIGEFTEYTSLNGTTKGAYYFKVTDGDMPEMLTALLRFIIVTYVSTDNNKEWILTKLVEQFNISSNTLYVIENLLNDIFIFINFGAESSITGRSTLGADIFLNAAFIIFYGSEKVVTPAFANWQNINKNIREAYQRVIESGSKYDKLYATNANAFLNKYFKSIVTLDKGVAQNGFISFFQNIWAWFNRIWEKLKFW